MRTNRHQLSGGRVCKASVAQMRPHSPGKQIRSPAVVHGVWPTPPISLVRVSPPRRRSSPSLPLPPPSLLLLPHPRPQTHPPCPPFLLRRHSAAFGLVISEEPQEEPDRRGRPAGRGGTRLRGAHLPEPVPRDRAGGVGAVPGGAEARCTAGGQMLGPSRAPPPHGSAFIVGMAGHARWT